MQKLGTYHNRTVYWLDYANFESDLPDSDWICLATANTEPDMKRFDHFIRTSIASGILEFKGHGAYGEKLHDVFDDEVNIMMVMENHPEIDVMTTWHNNQTLADAFWQCFFATCIPDNADFDKLSVVCTDLDGVNRVEELKACLQQFENGWLPR